MLPTRKEAPTGNKHPYGGNSSYSSNQSFSSNRGKQNFRGSNGVVFSTPQQGKGAWIPLPNDSFKASSSPPVGGRLPSFSRDWQTNNCSSNVLNLITNGYVLPFLSMPNLVSFSLIISEYKALSKDQALPHCIQSLLSKNVIERVENVKSLGFYNRLFLVPMPHQGGGQL